MSCVIFSSRQTAAVAHGLAFMLNGSCGMFQLAAAPELFAALDDCREYPQSYYFDEGKIFSALVRLNENAYNKRYELVLDNNADVPSIPEDYPHLLHALPYNEHYILDGAFYAYAKALDSLIYQCSEDATQGNVLLDALEKTAARFRSFLVAQTDEYNAAAWLF